MSDREFHCPFLNRTDHRCAAYFSIEGLQHAFEHCFHAYKSCEVYHELLAERMTRRGQAAAGEGSEAPAGPFVWASACKPAESDVKTRFVQVRLPTLASTPAVRAAAGAGADRYAKPAA